MQLEPLVDRPIIHTSQSDALEGNVNGPSLIRVPSWISNPLGRYYLYFGHHTGKTIRLAYADELSGPWHLYEPGALKLADSLFPTLPPQMNQLHSHAKQLLELGYDGTYPHIASPDVIVDEQQKQIRLYYHGRIENGLQFTRVALSTDGVNFTPHQPLLGRPYMRVFQHEAMWYAMAMPGQLYCSKDGLSDFELGPNLFEPVPVRHVGLLKQEGRLLIFWTEIGDMPEHIKMSTVDITTDWLHWQMEQAISLRKAEREWEGAEYPVVPSTYGVAHGPVNQLRDPAVFVEDNQIYILYSVAGEQGIAIGKMKGWQDDKIILSSCQRGIL